jgi:hypothetical protein
MERQDSSKFRLCRPRPIFMSVETISHFGTECPMHYFFPDYFKDKINIID